MSRFIALGSRSAHTVDIGSIARAAPLSFEAQRGGMHASIDRAVCHKELERITERQRDDLRSPRRIHVNRWEIKPALASRSEITCKSE